jgi:hypothetical protein
MAKARIITLVFLLQFIFSAGTAYGSISIASANQQPIPAFIFPALEISVRAFISLPMVQLESLAGRKLTLRERISFSVMKLKMKHDLKRNPDVQLSNYYGKNANRKLGTGWWILIIVVGVVLLAFFLYILAFGGAFS